MKVSGSRGEERLRGGAWRLCCSLRLHVKMPAGSCPSSSAEPPRPDGRKSSKPVMEKRRRARINESLGQLKTLILDALQKDSSRHSKLEKADILEMTVKHLRNLQRLQMTAAVNMDPTIVAKYRAGFSECVGEVTRFLSTCEGVNAEVRTRLLGHLATCVTQIHTVNLYGAPVGALGHTSTPVPLAPLKSASQLHVSPGAVKVFGGFQVVPSPDGHFAFLVPSAAVSPLMAQSSPHMSAEPPAATSDSVWRPW